MSFLYPAHMYFRFFTTKRGDLRNQSAQVLFPCGKINLVLDIFEWAIDPAHKDNEACRCDTQNNILCASDQPGETPQTLISIMLFCLQGFNL